MTEEDAQAWVVQHHGVDALERLSQFVDLVRDENGRQNLIAPSTVEQIWVRHVLDSAQLMAWDMGGTWLDIGTGGGFPGMVVALLRTDTVVLSEPRRRRADFLRASAMSMGLAHVSVEQRQVERLAIPSSTISARAVASINQLLTAAAGCVTATTRWLLPRGRITTEDIEQLHTGKYMFHVEQSLTSPESSVLVLNGAA